MNDEEFARKEVCEILRFIIWQITEGKMTAEELESFQRIMREKLIVTASINDIACHCGQSESNVRNVINRHLIEKPHRTVMYNFLSFLRIRPKSWRK